MKGPREHLLAAIRINKIDGPYDVLRRESGPIGFC